MMAEDTAAARLSRQEISDAVSGLGWRLVLGALRGCVPVGSLRQAADVAARVVAACGPDADGGLVLDLRPDGVLITLRDAASGRVTPHELEFARLIGAVQPGLPGARSVQALEIAVDALESARVRPFWKAIMGYIDEADAGPEDAIVDPLGQGPAIWFQQMDAPRPQRNRIHIDISVPHDEASRRIEAATAAGGAVIDAAAAPAFWVLADAEGNEACITTWQGRD